MGSGLREQRVGRHHPARDRAEQLHLLAAHHVRAAACGAGYAGDDRGAVIDPVEPRRQLVDPRRRRDIGHDAPADGRADHAREQHWQVAGALADRRDLAGEVGDRRGAAVVTLGMRDRAVLETEHAPVGRAPVDGEKGGRRTHHQVA